MSVNINGKASIVIPVYNDKYNLKTCLEVIEPVAIRHNWEVIVVDDASTDGSTQGWDETHVRLVKLDKNKGVSNARNMGAELSNNEIIVFVDADILPNKDCLENLVSFLLERNDIHSVGAWEVPVNLNTESWSSNFVCLRSCWGFEWKENENERFFSCFKSECSAIRKEVFMEVGKFDLKFSGAGMEEFQLGHRLEESGKKNVVIKNATFEHYYKPLLPRCRNLIHRTARWVPLLLGRRKLESQGAVGTSGAAVSVFLSIVLASSLILSLISQIFLYASLVAIIIQLIVEMKFLKFSHRIFGIKMLFFAIPATQLMNLSIFIGFLLGVLKLLDREQAAA
ncbi:MAG: glycosyltransferase family 2 protein [Alphaproteobacteria bacterium]|nr:glycosyltransferase family 2 protein [Alphaproteobacteria bacterium]